MEHVVCSSRKDACLFIDPNMDDHFHEILNSSHEQEQEESPFKFSGFPSPFFDDISAAAAPAPNITAVEPLASESKRVVKKRSVGKKDRHSKIHTAQGLRDRRMRLSLHIARKFFDLQDLLGFDKASSTIEWLFSKSNKAIKEVALQSFAHHHHSQQLITNNNNNNQSMMISEENIFEVLGLTSQIKNKINSKKEMKNNKKDHLRKQLIPNNNSSTTRNEARARARDRTRERLMMKEVEKSSKELLMKNPKDEIYKLGLGYLGSPNNIHNNNIEEELGFSNSSPSEPIFQDSSSPCTLESTTIDHVNNSFENYNNSGGSTNHVGGAASSTSSSYLINQMMNPPAGWLNSSNGLLGMQLQPGDWEAADRFIADYLCNYEIHEPPTTSTIADAVGDPPALTGDHNIIYDEQNPITSFSMCTTYYHHQH